MRAPASLVFFETECGPIPQSAARPSTGRLRSRANPFGRCVSPIAGGRLPRSGGCAHVPRGRERAGRRGTPGAMDVLVAGGHGQVALHLLRLLAERGHHARGLIRNADHAPDLERVGAVPVLCDLETDEAVPRVGAAEAIVFAAGAGPGSGPERKRTVDYGGAVKLIEAAEELGVRRYLMVSSMGAGDPASAPEAMRPYQQAKHDADEALAASGLEWTIVRPGGLTNEPGTGFVEAAPALGRRGQIPRDDVALVLLECLDAANTVGVTFELLAGETPARDAVRGLYPPRANEISASRRAARAWRAPLPLSGGPRRSHALLRRAEP